MVRQLHVFTVCKRVKEEQGGWVPSVSTTVPNKGSRFCSKRKDEYVIPVLRRERRQKAD